jgi:hypothetical protein
MARSREAQHGYMIEYDVMKGFSPTSTGANTIQLTPQRLPKKLNGLNVAVVEFKLVTRTIQATIPIAKILDAMSMAQVFSQISLYASKDSPLGKVNGNVIAEGVDGPTFFDAMSFYAGVPAVESLGKSLIDFQTPAGSAATAVASASIPLQGVMGDVARPLQFCGPHGYGGSAATAAFSDRLTFRMNFVPRGESVSDGAVPAEFFTGEGLGEAGSLVWTENTAIDGLTLTVGNGTTTYDLIAVLWLYPDGKRPLPMVPNVRVTTFTEQRFRAQRGVRFGLWLRKALSAGATAAHDYTRISIKDSKGIDLIQQDLATHLSALKTMVRDNEWKPTQIGAGSSPTNPTLNARNATHHAQWGVPLILNDGSKLEGLGDIDGELDLNIITTGETSHRLVDVVGVPCDEALAEADAKLTGLARDYQGRNGNAVSRAVAKFFPGKMKPRAPGQATK